MGGYFEVMMWSPPSTDKSILQIAMELKESMGSAAYSAWCFQQDSKFAAQYGLRLLPNGQVEEMGV